MLALAGTGDGSLAGTGSARAVWQPAFSTGLDAYLHTYSLATTDTTESLAEYLFSAALTGHSSWRARHRWRLQAEVSAGSELYRERIELEYGYRDHRERTRLRISGTIRGRQYRETTDYTLSSDNSEGRLDLRVRPSPGSRQAVELRAWTGYMDYRRPSSLEVDYTDLGTGIFLRSLDLDGPVWNLGAKLMGRDYPDSSSIDRRILSLEGECLVQDPLEGGFRAYHKTERRHIRDETARPSAWSHWTELDGKVSAGPGRIFMDLQSEIWRYDQDLSAYFDSWRLKAVTGYGWGEILTTTWELGLAVENLSAPDSPEAYTELGLRAGAESYGGAVGGSLTLEVGRRMYRDWNAGQGDEVSGDVAAEDGHLELYSDFTYWEIWLTADWRISSRLDLDIMFSFEPESHTEKNDDMTLGFATARLVYRP